MLCYSTGPSREDGAFILFYLDKLSRRRKALLVFYSVGPSREGDVFLPFDLEGPSEKRGGEDFSLYPIENKGM